MAEIPERRKKVEERRGETKGKRERERERKDPATVRYFLIDVDIWKTLRRTSMHRGQRHVPRLSRGRIVHRPFYRPLFFDQLVDFNPRIGSEIRGRYDLGRPTFRLKRLKTRTIWNELEINGSENDSKIDVRRGRSTFEIIENEDWKLNSLSLSLFVMWNDWKCKCTRICVSWLKEETE